MAGIRFEGVSKLFGDVVAVDDLSLEAPDGEFLVLVGPSGSGKTTALRLLAGLEGASGGNLWIGDRDVTRLRPQDRDIAMVFQDYALYPQMSVERNMGFALKNQGMKRSVIQQRVRDAAERLDLGPLLHRKPSQLSGGQRQRVALGRAIVREPAVFLMDEPLSNLDASLRVQMRGEIKRLQRDLGTTTVFVTHDQVEAMTMGDRIAIMRDGRLEQLGRPPEIYSRPATRFVGGFIGSPGMAFSRFAVERAGDGIVLSRAECRLDAGPIPAPPTDELIVGVRPEDAIVWSEETGLLGPVAGSVTYVEDLGREWFAGVEFAEGSTFIVRGSTHPIPEIEARIAFGFRPSGLYLFHPETELCLFHPEGDRDLPRPLAVEADDAGAVELGRRHEAR
jgi:multiple sugar transport system ATP-binding protein